MTFPLFLFLFSSLLFAGKRLLRYLRFLQQDAYDPKRFISWVFKKQAFDKKGSLIALFSFAISFFFPIFSFYFGAFCLLFLSFKEQDPRKAGKLKLKMTARAKRIYGLSLFFFLLLQTVAVFLNSATFFLSEIVLFQSIPFLLALSVCALFIEEQRRQKGFVKEAEKKFKEASPYVIGITGSYGKTSTKDALGHILQTTMGSVFWPSKGVNTEMGITMEMRFHLKKGVQYAVVEMAAYGEGSIEKLCRLTPPKAGIITTVGLAHLERFGSQETIWKAKSELAQAIPYDGILVCNGDNPGARRISEVYPKETTLLFGFCKSGKKLDCWIKKDWVEEGKTHFVFEWKGKSYRGKTSLMGKNALLNVAASFTMAAALGADPEFVLGAISNLKAVENRLEVSKTGGITYVRDAYNSNPDGFLDALDVLSTFQGGRKILMTPGMVELSEKSDKIHEKVGQKAAKICDFAIIVGETNKELLQKGLLGGGMKKERIIEVNGREEAFKELQAKVKAGDAVLIENDLPDLYEILEGF